LTSTRTDGVIKSCNKDTRRSFKELIESTNGNITFDLQIRALNPHCYKGVWCLPDGVIDSTKEDFATGEIMNAEVQLTLSRDNCFFMPYEHTLSLECAVELEQRASDRTKANTDRRISKRASWAAIISAWAAIALIIVNMTQGCKK